MRVRGLLIAAVTCVWLPFQALACEGAVVVCDKGAVGDFALITNGQPVQVYVAPNDLKGVVRVANDFAADLERVSGRKAIVVTDASKLSGEVVVIGALGSSILIDDWVKAKKLKVETIKGQWEAYSQTVLANPTPKIKKALVIAGADKRGAIFGAYDLSARMGVSPWYWWADVPVAPKANLYVTSGERHDQPKVKYRGFFINDEAPAFSTWTEEKFGGANSKAYAHVFELLLRLKGNYLWPAMWPPRAFNDDDPQNMVLADEMGVVMGTSHHEPLTRAHDEWHRNKNGGVTGGKWDYATNAANLRAFWRGGIERMMSKGDGKGYENLITVGMRGDGDEAMSEGTATQLLETIVADQRAIIAEVTKKPASETPQVWALYKEVQDYYDHGMKVPDDVILLFADDNWGQIRRLPEIGKSRPGGYGVYYHFDYVGGPRNYKWLNTNQIEKTWQQMDLAYQRGAKALWIVNVGDIKPVEFPLTFFMDQAWNPEAMTPDALEAYPSDWARKIFGATQGEAIATLVTRYSQLAARRKPELINADGFALGESTGDTLNGGEFGAMVAEWQTLEDQMKAVKAALPPQQHDAYFQLVEHPILAMANLYRLYYNVAWNRRLAAAKDARANIFADRAEMAFRRDQEITDAYHALGGGKWQGMMLQTHIGYTNWQQPDTQVMPEVVRVTGKAKAIVFAAGKVAMSPGVVAIEAPHYTRAVNGAALTWTGIPHLGRTSGAVMALPQGRPATAQSDNVRLEYDVEVAKAGDLIVQLYLVPTLDVSGQAKLRIGVSVDDGPMQALTDSLVPAPNAAIIQAQKDWNKAVMDNVRVVQTTLPSVTAGKHVIKVWRLDDNVVLQKLVASTASIAPSYLGSPEN